MWLAREPICRRDCQHGQSGRGSDAVRDYGRSARTNGLGGARAARIGLWQSRRKLETLQGDFDPLAVARHMLGGRSLDKSDSSAGGSSYSLEQVWERYRQRRQPRERGSVSGLPGYVSDPVAWASIQQRLAAIGERLLAGQQYQGPALQTEIDKLAKELGDDQQWSLKGDLPQLDILQ